jgi:hypothetical protein
MSNFTGRKAPTKGRILWQLFEKSNMKVEMDVSGGYDGE